MSPSSSKSKTSSEQSKSIFILQPSPFSSSWTPTLPLYFRYTGRSKDLSCFGYRLMVTNFFYLYWLALKLKNLLMSIEGYQSNLELESKSDPKVVRIRYLPESVPALCGYLALALLAVRVRVYGSPSQTSSTCQCRIIQLCLKFPDLEKRRLRTY